MKKASMEAIANHLYDLLLIANDDKKVLLQNLINEINDELSKSKAKADANRALYDEYHIKVIEVLSNALAPVTAQEIADATKIARGKIVYGLNNYWKSEVIRDDSGKTATYTLA